jgi:hypothetical protein
MKKGYQRELDVKVQMMENPQKFAELVKRMKKYEDTRHNNRPGQFLGI